MVLFKNNNLPESFGMGGVRGDAETKSSQAPPVPRSN